MSTHTATADHHDAHDHKPGFVERWFFSTNHKDIGTLYLLFSFLMVIVGAAMSVVIRAELAVPGLQFVSPHFFNQMTTMHALVMIFGAVMPAFVGLANWMIPLQIGAPDMALPRMNNWSFWLLPVAFSLLLLSLFLPGGAPAGRRLLGVRKSVLRKFRHAPQPRGITRRGEFGSAPGRCLREPGRCACLTKERCSPAAAARNPPSSESCGCAGWR